MKFLFNFKESKRWFVIISILLFLIIVVAYMTNQNKSAVVSDTNEFYGNYIYEKTVYISPLNSFCTFDGFVEYYTFSRDSMTITDKIGLQRKIPAQYAKVVVDTEDFNAAFNIDEYIPDITKYKERYQYTLNDFTPINPVYRIYLMDDEVWLASMNSGTMWTIYKLKRYNGKIPYQSFESGIE